MKKLELDLRTNCIVALISEGVPLNFKARVKCQKELSNIQNATKPINEVLEKSQNEIIEKYKLVFNDKGEIDRTDDNANAIDELIALKNESNSIDVDVELIKFEESDFKNSKGEYLDISTNIYVLINDFINEIK